LREGALKGVMERRGGRWIGVAVSQRARVTERSLRHQSDATDSYRSRQDM
jgi:hypothetical protein